MPSLIGPELQCQQVYYFLQKGSEKTNSRRAVRRPHTYHMSFLHPWDMQNLLQSNQHLDLTYHQSTPLCQNKFGPRKSNLHPLLFLNPLKNFFQDTLFFCFVSTRNINNKMILILDQRQSPMMFANVCNRQFADLIASSSM